MIIDDIKNAFETDPTNPVPKIRISYAIGMDRMMPDITDEQVEGLVKTDGVARAMQLGPDIPQELSDVSEFDGLIKHGRLFMMTWGRKAKDTVQLAEDWLKIPYKTACSEVGIFNQEFTLGDPAFGSPPVNKEEVLAVQPRWGH